MMNRYAIIKKIDFHTYEIYYCLFKYKGFVERFDTSRRAYIWDCKFIEANSELLQFKKNRKQKYRSFYLDNSECGFFGYSSFCRKNQVFFYNKPENYHLFEAKNKKDAIRYFKLYLLGED